MGKPKSGNDNGHSPDAQVTATFEGEDVRIEVIDFDSFVQAPPDEELEAYVADDSAYGEHAIKVTKGALRGLKLAAVG